MLLIFFQFITLFSLVTLGFYVFAVNPRRRANQAFATFNGLLAFWTARDIVFWNFAEFSAQSEAWLISGLIASLLMMLSLVVFSEDFPEPKGKMSSSSLAAMAPSVILIPACLGGFLWEEFDLLGETPRLTLTVSGYVFATYVLALFAWGAFILIRRLHLQASGQIRKQLATVLVGLGLNAILISIPMVVLPLLGDVSWLSLSSLFAIPGVILNAFAILNFRLFSLQSVLDEVRHFPIAHKVAVTVASIAVASFLLLQIPIVWWSFTFNSGEQAWVRYISFSLIAALLPNLILVLAVVRTISRPIKRLTVAAVETSKGRYGMRVEGRTTSDEIGILTDAFNTMSEKMAHDLAILQRMNDRLLRTEKLASIGTLSAGIAHEILNPLSAVSSIVQNIIRGDVADEKTREQLAIISKQIDRVTEITGEMLAFAATRSERRIRGDLNEIAKDSLRLLGFDSSFKRIPIEVDFCEEIPPIDCDPDQLQQVFVNLLLNSREALSEDGAISVSTYPMDGKVVAEIRDNGCGIDEEYASRIFDPFFTTKGEKGGTGLGLAVAYGIIDSHNGKIEALPNEPKGTIIRISLPRSSVR